MLPYLAYGTLFSCVLCNFFQIYEYGEPFFKYAKFLVSPLDIDPTYLGLYIGFTVVFIVDSISKNWYILVLKILTILYLFIFLFYMGSKISVLIVSLLLLIKVIRYKPQNRNLKIVMIATLIFGFFISFNIPYAQRLFYKPIIKMVSGDSSYLFYDRDIIWNCSIEAIKDSIFLGYGTGDDIDVIKDCLQLNNFDISRDHNAHNQYLSALLRFGILGLLLLAIVFFDLYKKNNSVFTIYFIAIFSVSFLTESVIDRNKGILLFVFVYSLIKIRSLR